MVGRRTTGVVEQSRFARKRWLAGGAAVVLLGVAGSVLAAREIARSDEATTQRTRAATSANVVSRLQLALQHEEDLVVDLSAFLVASPHPSNATFNAWLAGARAFMRYPEVAGIARIVLVSSGGASRLRGAGEARPCRAALRRRILRGHSRRGRGRSTASSTSSA